MTLAQIVLLGGIAGFTSYFDVPVGRLRTELPRLTTLLNGIATGILVVLLRERAHARQGTDRLRGESRRSGRWPVRQTSRR